MKLIDKKIEPRQVLQDDLLFITTRNCIIGSISILVIVIGSIVIFGKFTLPKMIGEYNESNLQIFFISQIPLIIATIVLIILALYRYKSIKALLSNGVIIKGHIVLIDTINNSEMLYIKVRYECFDKLYERIKRIKRYRVYGLFKQGDVVELIIDPQRPRYFVFKDLYY